MTATDTLSLRDFSDIGFGMGYGGCPLIDAVRGLGIAHGQPMTAEGRRALLDGWNHGDYCRKLDDASAANPPGEIDWTDVPL